MALVEPRSCQAGLSLMAVYKTSKAFLNPLTIRTSYKNICGTFSKQGHKVLPMTPNRCWHVSPQIRGEKKSYYKGGFSQRTTVPQKMISSPSAVQFHCPHNKRCREMLETSTIEQHLCVWLDPNSLFEECKTIRK